MAQTQKSAKHRMLSEIYDQPRAIRDTVANAVADNGIFRDELAGIEQALRTFRKLIIAASGSSRHAGLAGEIMIEDLSGTAVDVEYASEYCYRSTHAETDPIVIVITQSGETADTIAAQREALARGAKTLAICNVAESTIAREASANLITQAGPELAVPATKSFTTQLTVLYLFALYLARRRGRMTSEWIRARIEPLLRLPDELNRLIPHWDALAAESAEHYREAASFLYLGRGVHYAIAREGALKLKEISYAHAEAYPTGEVRHGPEALVSGGMPIVALATRDQSDPDSVLRYKKTLLTVGSLKKHGGNILAIASEGDAEIASSADHAIFVPQFPELLLPIAEVIPLQLFAYHIARLNGYDIDNPRNLTKAVVSE
jgi:glucosamine--fructose-6-phosphate aminotransferase (isomerizing)